MYNTPNLVDRCKLWYKLSGKEIRVVLKDLTDPIVMENLIKGSINYDWKISNKKFSNTEVIVHYAEQPSAPYSMITVESSNKTIVNNLIVTNNIMFALKNYSPDTHLIKLGTMGEYGTPNIDIEEGWLEVTHNGRKDKFLFPRAASSIYHTSKIMDTDLLWFGVRMWGLKVTDLMQGPVYGINTSETQINEDLKTSFFYDEIFGTIINRFVTQAVMGHPLTVYGEGGQTRGFINIRDTMQCVYLSSENEPMKGELRIYNQITETFSALELAEIIKEFGNKINLNVKIKKIFNPRIEKEKHYYNPKYQGLIKLGVKPHKLNEDVLSEFFEIVKKNKSNISEDLFLMGYKW